MNASYSRLIFIAFLSFAVLFTAYSQQQAKKVKPDQEIETRGFLKVKGIVTAFDKYYVMSAEVTSRRTRSKACTDSFGRFEIMAPYGDVLIFKANGFEKNRIELTPNDGEITVNMNLKPGGKNERIAVIYGHLNEEAIAYAVEHYCIRNDEFLKYSNMRELFRAELGGVRVSDHGNIQVFVRGGDLGLADISENSGAASFILDGMIVNSIDFLNPMYVKSVTLVKDAAGAGIYGSRGANGVVLITTK